MATHAALVLVEAAHVGHSVGEVARIDGAHLRPVRFERRLVGCGRAPRVERVVRFAVAASGQRFRAATPCGLAFGEFCGLRLVGVAAR